MTESSDASADLYVKDYAGGFVHIFLVEEVKRNAILNELDERQLFVIEFNHALIRRNLLSDVFVQFHICYLIKVALFFQHSVDTFLPFCLFLLGCLVDFGKIIRVDVHVVFIIAGLTLFRTRFKV